VTDSPVSFFCLLKLGNFADMKSVQSAKPDHAAFTAYFMTGLPQDVAVRLAQPELLLFQAIEGSS
jgi:hypothetical protein